MRRLVENVCFDKADTAEGMSTEEQQRRLLDATTDVSIQP